MPRVHYVKKARKRQQRGDVVIEVGESYYWWAFRRGGRRISKTPPKPWQLTQSEFLKQKYRIEHEIGELGYTEWTEGGAEALIEQIEALAEEQQEKMDNMPENLQFNSPTYELLEERQQACEAWAEELREVWGRDDWTDEGEEPEDEEPIEPDRDSFDEGEDGEAEYESAMDEYQSELDDLEERRTAYEDRQEEIAAALDEFKEIACEV